MIHPGLRAFEPLAGNLNLLVRIVNEILLRQAIYRVELRIPTGQRAGDGCRVGPQAAQVSSSAGEGNQVRAIAALPPEPDNGRDCLQQTRGADPGETVASWE